MRQEFQNILQDLLPDIPDKWNIWFMDKAQPPADLDHHSTFDRDIFASFKCQVSKTKNMEILFSQI